MLISKASFNVNTLVVVARTLYRDSDASEGETLDIRPIPYTLKQIRNLFCKMFANCRFRSRSLFSSCFSSKSKTILPCRAFSLSSVFFCCCLWCIFPLATLTQAHACDRFFRSSLSVLFVWRDLACCGCRVYVYFITFFSKLSYAGICANTHTLTDPSGSRLLLFCVTAKFTPLSRKVHYTPLRNGGKSYLVCFTAHRG